MGVTFINTPPPPKLSGLGLVHAPIHTDAMAHYPYNPGIESAMIFVSKYGDVVNMAHRYGDNIAIPRRFAPSLGIDNRSDRVIGVLKPKCGYKDAEQERCVKESLALLNKGVDHIIESPTGSGKSMMGVFLGCYTGRATLIVVTKEDLIDGWKKNLALAGVPEDEIGIAQADKLKYKGCRFVIGMIHSLAIRGKYDHEFLSYFGLVIFDEVHRAAADSFQIAAQQVHAKLRVGLSATPDRPDGKDLVLRGHIGEVLVRGTSIPMVPKVLVKETGWEIPEYCKNYGPGQMMIVEKAMAYSAPRNAIIAAFVREAFLAGRNTVVMSSNLAHLDKLHNAIGPLVGGENLGRYVGQMSKEELAIGSRRRVVLATYGMCAEGTDCPWWDTLVPATPRKDQKQINGRVMRSLEGKKEPVILDLVDRHKIFRAYHNNRLKQYYEVGAKVVKMRDAA